MEPQSADAVLERKRVKRGEVFNHLLIGRIKDTNIMYSFIVQCTLVENSGNMFQ